MIYSVIDVETTGGSPKKERIIEIAIIKTDGNKILDQYESFVNPDKNIPPFVSKLTGISNKMLENAPSFEKILSAVKAFTKDTIIVAHNAKTDYGFLKAEFKNCGQYFERKRICTIKLAKKMFPQLEKTNLSFLAEKFEIAHNNKHRAMGDAVATTKLLKYLLENGGKQFLSSFDQVSENDVLKQLNIPKAALDAIPEDAGVLLFYNKEKELHYATRADDMKGRISDFLFNFDKGTRKGDMLRKTYDLKFHRTGSDLLAQLKEADYIIKYKPTFNKKAFKINKIYIFDIYKDKFGYYNLNIVNNRKIKENEFGFSNVFKAKSALDRIIKKHKLCPNLCGQKKTQNESCIHLDKKHCNGACINKESFKDYNLRFKAAINALKFRNNFFAIVDETYKVNEDILLVIKDEKLMGYKYLNNTEKVNFEENELLSNLNPIANHPEISNIIRTALAKQNYKKLHIVE